MRRQRHGLLLLLLPLLPLTAAGAVPLREQPFVVRLHTIPASNEGLAAANAAEEGEQGEHRFSGFSSCRVRLEAYAASALISRARLLRPVKLARGQGGGQQSHANARTASAYFRLQSRTSPETAIFMLDTENVVHRTVDGLDFFLEHLSMIDRVMVLKLRPDKMKREAMELPTQQLVAQREALRDIAMSPSWRALDPHTLAVLAYCSEGQKANAHTAAPSRRLFVQSAFWSTYRYFPHLVMCVQSDEDFEHLRGLSLPLFQLLQLRVEHPDHLNVACVLAIREAMTNGEYAEYDRVYFSDTDQMIHLRRSGFHPHFVRAANEDLLLVPHRFVATLDPQIHPPAVVTDHRDVTQELVDFHHHQGERRGVLAMMSVKPIHRVASEDALEELSCCFEITNCAAAQERFIGWKSPAVEALQVMGGTPCMLGTPYIGVLHARPCAFHSTRTWCGPTEQAGREAWQQPPTEPAALVLDKPRVKSAGYDHRRFVIQCSKLSSQQRVAWESERLDSEEQQPATWRGNSGDGGGDDDGSGAGGIAGPGALFDGGTGRFDARFTFAAESVPQSFRFRHCPDAGAASSPCFSVLLVGPYVSLARTHARAMWIGEFQGAQAGGPPQGSLGLQCRLLPSGERRELHLERESPYSGSAHTHRLFLLWCELPAPAWTGRVAIEEQAHSASASQTFPVHGDDGGGGSGGGGDDHGDDSFAAGVAKKFIVQNPGTRWSSTVADASLHRLGSPDAPQGNHAGWTPSWPDFPTRQQNLSLGICMRPMRPQQLFDLLSPAALIEWLEYHIRSGVDYVNVYLDRDSGDLTAIPGQGRYAVYWRILYHYAAVGVVRAVDSVSVGLRAGTFRTFALADCFLYMVPRAAYFIDLPTPWMYLSTRENSKQFMSITSRAYTGTCHTFVGDLLAELDPTGQLDWGIPLRKLMVGVKFSHDALQRRLLPPTTAPEDDTEAAPFHPSILDHGPQLYCSAPHMRIPGLPTEATLEAFSRATFHGGQHSWHLLALHLQDYTVDGAEKLRKANPKALLAPVPEHFKAHRAAVRRSLLNPTSTGPPTHVGFVRHAFLCAMHPDEAICT